MLIATLENNPNIRIICEVADGAQAVEKANELQPDLILLDIGLPSLNGIEAARQISGLSPKSKIIFVTQEISAEVVTEAFEAGASGYVVKTDAARDLCAAVEAVLQRLQAEGLDISGLSEQGRYLSLDSSDLLSTFMVNNLPDRDRFMKIAGDVYMAGARALEADHNCVAVCGECAALLWSQGN